MIFSIFYIERALNLSVNVFGTFHHLIFSSFLGFDEIAYPSGTASFNDSSVASACIQDSVTAQISMVFSDK